MNTQIENKLDSSSIEVLKDMAKLLMADYRDGAEVLLNGVLDQLMLRLPSNEFQDFANSL